MSEPGRGPTGAASLPPDWLLRARLPLTELPADRTLARIHRTEHAPIFFSPDGAGPPLGRFDSATGAFRVLYAALTFAGAFAETLLRNPARRLVGGAEIAARSLAILSPSRAIRLVPMHGAGLQVLGVDNAITTGPYAPCGAWGDALFAHPDRPDGIAYASRHDPEQLCVALFARPDLTLSQTTESVPLLAIAGDVAAVLRRYGKGLDV